MKKNKSARQKAAEELAEKDSWLQRYQREQNDERDAKAEGQVTSRNTQLSDALAISSAGGDPRRDRNILRGTYINGKDFRPDVLNEPVPEEQMSRDFTPAWDTTFGGPYQRRPDPEPQAVQPTSGKPYGGLEAAILTNSQRGEWLRRQIEKSEQDREQEEIVLRRARSTNAGRDRARPPEHIESAHLRQFESRYPRK
jgi:hypothetical protein